MDIAVVLDNTGGLTEEQCEIQLTNIADLFRSIKGNNRDANIRISLIEVDGDDCQVSIPLDSNLNRFFAHYIHYIKTLECKNGFGHTKLGCGLLAAAQELSQNGNENAQKKIITINNCLGNDARCSEVANRLSASGIHEDDIIFINAMGGICGTESTHNFIKSSDHYAQCITNTICVADEIKNMEFHKAINDCHPSICKHDTKSDSYDSNSKSSESTSNSDSDSEEKREERKRRHRSWWNRTSTRKPTKRPSLVQTSNKCLCILFAFLYEIM